MTVPQNPGGRVECVITRGLDFGDGRGSEGRKQPMWFSKFKERSALPAGIALLLGNKLMLRVGLRRRVDGWRRGAGLVLRGEAATFVLSAFGLDIWSDVERPVAPSVAASQEHFAGRLACFLAGEADCHVCVRRGTLEDCAEPCGGPSYSLGFEDRPDGPARFVPPGNWAGEDHLQRSEASTDLLLNVVGRIGRGGGGDVWLCINHVGIDGVAVQEMLSRLEAAWGIAEDVVYPTPDSFVPHAELRPCAGREGLAQVQAFMDFGPLLEWRKTENARLPEAMTLSAAILWCLARQPAFAGICMGTTVDVPPIDGLGRGVGVVVVRPADYRQRKDGLVQYVQDFNRQLELTRRRASESCSTLDAAALIPPGLAARLLRHALQGDRAFGSMGLTLIRDAKVFGAPMGDFGHPDGFLAIGNVAIPAGDGRKVGCITIKGPAAKISGYPTLVQEAIRECAAGPR